MPLLRHVVDNVPALGWMCGQFFTLMSNSVDSDQPCFTKVHNWLARIRFRDRARPEPEWPLVARLLGEPQLVASVWSASTSPRSRTLTWILHDTGSDRLGITAIYLSLIDMHVVVTMLRIGRGSFSSRLEIPD